MAMAEMLPGPREKLLNDVDWKDVMHINTFAAYMGYLSMAIKGLGFLVLTWTTVVLLGGHVSLLQKRDFWSLTFITLVQTAGIYDVVLHEKLSYKNDSLAGLIGSVFLTVLGERGGHTPVLVARFLLALVLVVAQLVVLIAILWPLGILYVLGILISGGISLWRLIERDYGRKLDGGAPNLVPAMDTLYSLALLQGVIFCYRFIIGRMGQRLARQVATASRTESELQVVSDYLRETSNECEKNPSFARGRTLITHAVDMIGSSSPVDCISGVKILYTAIVILDKQLKQLEGRKGSSSYHQQQDIIYGQRMLMKHLTLYTASSSSRHILQKLLKTLDLSGLHDTDTRIQAATIVDQLAFNIKLDQYPRGIEHISSLIGTFEDFSIAEPYQRDCLFDVYEQDWDQHARCLPHSHSDDIELQVSYKLSLLKGLSILRKLAVNENNCRVMSNTWDLVSKIMAPVTSDLLDHTTDDHGAWSDVVHASVRVMARLIAARGETGAKLRHEISSCQEAISTLWRIIRCSTCNEGLRFSAIQILTVLYMDTESSPADLVIKEETREHFVRIVVNTFTNSNKSISIRANAGGALLALIRANAVGALLVLCIDGGGNDDTVVMQTDGGNVAARGNDDTVVMQTDGGNVAASLTKALLHDEDSACRQKAAEILKHLCTHYTKEDDCPGTLEKATTNAMPESLGKILGHGDETHSRKESDKDGFAELKEALTDAMPTVIEDIILCPVGTRAGKDGFAKPETDIENQRDGTQGKKEHEKEGKVSEEVILIQTVASTNLLSSLLYLCGTVYDTFGPDLASQFHASKFLDKLKEIAVIKGEHPTVENRSVLMAITKMVTSMSSSRLIKREDLESLRQALSKASENMQVLDYSMIFRSGTFSDKSTLASLVKKAREPHDKTPSTPASG